MPQLLRFGIPFLSRRVSLQAGKAFMAILERHTSHPLLLRVAATYSELVDGLAEGRYDFAWLPPVEAYQLAAHAGVELVLQAVRANGSHYYSLIFTRGDSPISSLADLSGRKVAFVHRRSASGYLLAAARMISKGVEISSPPLFMRSHEDVLRAVQDGRADAGATYGNLLLQGQEYEIVDASWFQLAPDISGQLRVLDFAGPIPTDAICAWPGTTRAMRHEITRAFLQVMETPDEAATMLELFGTSRFSRPNPQDLEEAAASHPFFHAGANGSRNVTGRGD